MFIHYFKKPHLLFVLIFFATVSFADAYKWVDNRGITNYSEKAPANQEAVLIQGPPPVVNPAGAQKQIDTLIEKQNGTFEENEMERQNVAEAEQVAEDQEEYCRVNQNNLQEYQNSPGRRMIDADGNVTQPTEEQRQQKIDEIQQRLTEHCM